MYFHCKNSVVLSKVRKSSNINLILRLANIKFNMANNNSHFSEDTIRLRSWQKVKNLESNESYIRGFILLRTSWNSLAFSLVHRPWKVKWLSLLIALVVVLIYRGWERTINSNFKGLGRGEGINRGQSSRAVKELELEFQVLPALTVVGLLSAGNW